jgi:elongation of very long chain fatty acids protein 6
MQWIADFESYESKFDAKPWTLWTEMHPEVVVTSVLVYFFVVFFTPRVLKRPWNLKPFFFYWNFFLALFSMVGSWKVVPTLINALIVHDFDYTICTEPRIWYNHGQVGLWVTLFVYSKIPELLDTFFLVFQKKEVIFLHWYHHFTVLMYCWHAYYSTISAGIWFCAMNYCVHSIMYMYFCLTSCNLPKPLFRAIRNFYAPVVTIAQLTQMALGIIITFKSAIKHQQLGTEGCWTNQTNYFFGFIMYFSYFLLFAVLFAKKYCQCYFNQKETSAQFKNKKSTTLRRKLH